MRWHLPSTFQFLLSVNNWLNSRIKVASAGKDRTKAGIGWLKRRDRGQTGQETGQCLALSINDD